jgi:hypothetical protein
MGCFADQNTSGKSLASKSYLMVASIILLALKSHAVTADPARP